MLDKYDISEEEQKLLYLVAKQIFTFGTEAPKGTERPDISPKTEISVTLLRRDAQNLQQDVVRVLDKVIEEQQRKLDNIPNRQGILRRRNVSKLEEIKQLEQLKADRDAIQQTGKILLSEKTNVPREVGEVFWAGANHVRFRASNYERIEQVLPDIEKYADFDRMMLQGSLDSCSMVLDSYTLTLLEDVYHHWKDKITDEEAQEVANKRKLSISFIGKGMQYNLLELYEPPEISLKRSMFELEQDQLMLSKIQLNQGHHQMLKEAGDQFTENPEEAMENLTLTVRNIIADYLRANKKHASMDINNPDDRSYRER